MNVTKLNKFFGYALFTVGALKLILMMLIVIQLTTAIGAVFSGGQVSTTDYTVATGVIGLAEIILAIGSIIMIIVNIQKESGVITGYLLGLGAILMEFIVPSMMIVFLIEVSLYMKAGSKIVNKNQEWNQPYQPHKTNKKMIQDTDWFYAKPKEENEKNNFKEKINQLTGIFDSEEIDETECDEKTYNENNDSEFLKKDIVTILLIILIVIVLIILGIYIYKMSTDEKENNNITTNNNENIIEQKQSIKVEQEINKIENQENTINSIIENEVQENIDNAIIKNETQENIEDFSKENNNVNIPISDERLIEIADKFNNCEASKRMRENSVIQYATAVMDGIKITCSTLEVTYSVKLTLNDNILSTEILDRKDGDDYERLIKANMAMILIDCIGQIKGYPEQAIFDVLYDESTSDFTLENEGIEMKRLENNKGGVIRVDLNSDFPFMNR